MIAEYFLAALVVVYLLYLLRFKIRSNYWTSLGIKQPASNPFPFGNNPWTCYERITGKTNLGDACYKQYVEFAGERLYGTYKLPTCEPVIMLRDPELIRDVLSKDFDHFLDRSRPFFGSDGPTETDYAWQRQVASARGEEWKELRSMFSPIFTSGKLRTMLGLVNAVGRDMDKFLEQKVAEGGRVELKDLFGKFAMDSSASCIFSIDAGSFKCEGGQDTEFIQHAKTMFAL